MGTINALGGKAKRPKPLPRPGQKDTDKVGNRAGRTSAEVKAYLDSLNPPAPAPQPVTDLVAAVDRHGELTEQHNGVLRDIHDQL